MSNWFTKKEEKQKYDDVLQQKETVYKKMQETALRAAAYNRWGAQQTTSQDIANMTCITGNGAVAVGPWVDPAAAYTIWGQLVWEGAPLPSDWRGAEYTEYSRTFKGREHPYWEVSFNSKWCPTPIFARFDAEKHTGEEVERIAKTFLEVINQRRLG